MGWFGRSKRVEAELQEVQAALATMRLELDRERADSVVLRERLQMLEPPPPSDEQRDADAGDGEDVNGTDSPSPATDVPPPVPSPTATGAWTPPLPDVSFDYLKALTETNAVSVAGQREQLVEVRSRLASVDARLEELTRAFTNQLNEVGQEVERLTETARTADRSNADGVSEERLDELRTNQIRIANEQARFAKSMQEQFATLADSLRRPSH